MEIMHGSHMSLLPSTVIVFLCSLNFLIITHMQELLCQQPTCCPASHFSSFYLSHYRGAHGHTLLKLPGCFCPCVCGQHNSPLGSIPSLAAFLATPLPAGSDPGATPKAALLIICPALPPHICQSGRESPQWSFCRFQGISCGQYNTGTEVIRAQPSGGFPYNFPTLNLKFTNAGSFRSTDVGLVLFGVHGC